MDSSFLSSTGVSTYYSYEWKEIFILELAEADTSRLETNVIRFQLQWTIIDFLNLAVWIISKNFHIHLSKQIFLIRITALSFLTLIYKLRANVPISIRYSSAGFFWKSSSYFLLLFAQISWCYNLSNWNDYSLLFHTHKQNLIKKRITTQNFYS